MAPSDEKFVFTAENFKNPLPQIIAKHKSRTNEKGEPIPLTIIDVPVTDVTCNEDLEGYGYLFDDPSEFTCEKGTFEIKKWPVSGWRQLDPNTGDEAGTTEGIFEVAWSGDIYRGKNNAINTINNSYLHGLGCSNPEKASASEPTGVSEECSDYGNCIYLWMTDYHPDGGQLFFAEPPTNKRAKTDEGGGEGGATDGCTGEFPFFVCLAKNTVGDDIKPSDMRGFKIPPGKGVYIHPGTWHNGFYVHRKYGPQRCFTRQGRVHARVSCSWVAEYSCMLRFNVKD